VAITLVGPLFVPYSRVDRRIQQIDEQVHQKENGNEGNDDPLHKDDIATVDGVDESRPTPGY